MMSEFLEIVLMKMLGPLLECKKESRLRRPFLHPTNLHSTSKLKVQANRYAFIFYCIH